MADSTAIGHLDRRAAALSDDESFAAWSRWIAPLSDGHELPELRLRERSLFKKIGSAQSWKTAGLVEASGWLQRRLADEVDSHEVRSALAESGRTAEVDRCQPLTASRFESQ